MKFFRIAFISADGDVKSTITRLTTIFTRDRRLYLWRDLGWLLLLVAIVWGASLGNWPLSVPDSARYAQVPQEMLASQQWVTPLLNGIEYLEKPPLFYWIQILAYKLLGVGARVALIPNFGFSLLIVAQVYLLGRALFNRQAAILAALIQASCLSSWVFIHVITLDILLTLTLTLAIGGFWLAILASDQLDKKNTKTRIASKGA